MWIFFLIEPKTEIDERPYPTGVWGTNDIPLPPGQHHVHVQAPYLLPRKVGPADTMITVAPNQVLPQYRLPVFAFSEGSIGPSPQSYKGVGPAIACA